MSHGCAALALVGLALVCADVGAQGNMLTIAANPNLSAIELINNFGAFAKALEQELGMKVSVVSGKDYEDTIGQLRNAKVDIAGTGAYGYVTAREAFGAKMIVRYVEEGGDAYHSVIIVRADSGIDSLKNLKGKRFAFTDAKSTSGYLMPVLALEKQGIAVKDLAKVEFVKKQPNSAIAVFSRQVDAAAMADNQLNEKYGVKLAELKTIWTSAPIPHGVWMARADMADAEVRRIARAILKVAQYSDVKQSLAKASVHGFVEGHESDFDGVRAAKQLLEKLESHDKP